MYDFFLWEVRWSLVDNADETLCTNKECLLLCRFISHKNRLSEYPFVKSVTGSDPPFLTPALSIWQKTGDKYSHFLDLYPAGEE